MGADLSVLADIDAIGRIRHGKYQQVIGAANRVITAGVPALAGIDEIGLRTIGSAGCNPDFMVISVDGFAPFAGGCVVAV